MSASNIEKGSLDELPGNSSSDDNIPIQPNNQTDQKLEWTWETDKANPLNWSTGKKYGQVGMAASNAFVA